MSKFKKLFSILSCSALAFPGLALAHGYGDYITPHGDTPIVWQGLINVQKLGSPTVNINCLIEVELEGPNENGDGVSLDHTDESHLKANITFIGGDAPCPALSVDQVTNIDLNASSQTITLNEIYVRTNLVPGDCKGNLTVTLTSSDGLQVPYTEFEPGDDVSGDCYVVGLEDLALISPDDVDIVADDHI